jgi:glycosyltransferase involved in cell wall biosynthesis
MAIKAIIFYHFFPHYRAGIIDELSRRLDITFVGDRVGAEGIEAFSFGASKNFLVARAHYFGKLVFQPRVLAYCLFAKQDVFVFLASPNHISTWIGSAIARLRGKRVIFWGHGHKSVKRTIKARVRVLFFSIAHGFYSYGWRAKENAVALGANPEMIYVGFNSLNYAKQAPLRDELLRYCKQSESSKSILKIFCISRLTAACRYDMLLDAVNLISNNGTRILVTFVGDGPMRCALEHQAKRLRLEASFLGAIYDEGRIAKLVFDADVTVSPGKVGLTAMHSLMFGTPVVTNDNFESQMPEVEAIVPGFTGELFSDGSVGDLAKKLASHWDRFPDRQLTRQRCFEMIDRLYNPETQAKVLIRAVSGLPADRGDDAFRMFEAR